MHEHAHNTKKSEESVPDISFTTITLLGAIFVQCCNKYISYSLIHLFASTREMCDILCYPRDNVSGSFKLVSSCHSGC